MDLTTAHLEVTNLYGAHLEEAYLGEIQDLEGALNLAKEQIKSAVT